MTNPMDTTQAVAAALEIGLPPVERPFAAAAEGLGLTEADFLSQARALSASGRMKRFGAFFDAAAFGYRGFLFGCADEPALLVDLCGAAHVTHVYTRREANGRSAPALWFTALFRDGEAQPFCNALRARGLPFVALATERQIKLRPAFVSGSASVGRETQTGSVTGLSAQERAVAASLATDLTLTARPFDAPARRAGMPTGEFVAVCAALARAGALRRIGGAFDHRRAGLAANTLLALTANVEGTSRAEREAFALPWISHCYLRFVYDSAPSADWPYNLYAMIHARSEDELRRHEDAAMAAFGPGLSLRTVAEHKKTPFLPAL